MKMPKQHDVEVEAGVLRTPPKRERKSGLAKTHMKKTLHGL